MRGVVALVVSLVAASYAGGAERVALVELFTSEGCSSCPSADSVLSAYRGSGEVALLGWHVDYWDYLGWKDRFGHAEATPRQRAYAEVLARGRVYTPQMVVNGAAEFVGSDKLRAKRAIESPMADPIPIRLSAAVSGDELAAEIAIDATDAAVYLAITEDGLVSEVTAGENRGRTLHHDGVVRHVEALGALTKVDSPRRVNVALSEDWKRENLNVVVWIQGSSSLRVLGVATVSLQPRR